MYVLILSNYSDFIAVIEFGAKKKPVSFIAVVDFLF